MLKNIIAIAVVSVVILAEVLAVYVMLPGNDELLAGKHADGQRTGSDEFGPGETGGKSRVEPEAEVDLGKFSVVVHQPEGSGTTRINFHLIGTVPESQREEFSQLLAKCQHRLRDQVIAEVQQTQIADLTEPGLALIKRKILERSNNLLGQPLLRAVILSDYSLVEH